LGATVRKVQSAAPAGGRIALNGKRWNASIATHQKVDYGGFAMPLSVGKSAFSLNNLPVIFVPSKAMSSAVSKFPIVYRNNYVSALKALSQAGKSTPVIQVLDFAQKYTAVIRWEDFDKARADLQATHAFMDADEAEDKGIRLVLPKDAG
jgi:hypothetical protein